MGAGFRVLVQEVGGFTGSRVHGCTGSQVHGCTGSQVHGFRVQRANGSSTGLRSGGTGVRAVFSTIARNV
jgi:hypothetical protein